MQKSIAGCVEILIGNNVCIISLNIKNKAINPPTVITASSEFVSSVPKFSALLLVFSKHKLLCFLRLYAKPFSIIPTACEMQIISVAVLLLMAVPTVAITKIGPGVEQKLHSFKAVFLSISNWLIALAPTG